MTFLAVRAASRLAPHDLVKSIVHRKRSARRGDALTRKAAKWRASRYTSSTGAPHGARSRTETDMKQALQHLTVATGTRGLHEVTSDIDNWIDLQGIRTGVLTVFCRHTSASLLIQENADPDVRADLERYFASIAPEAPGRYVHETEGPDDMPAHLRTALTTVQLSIPVEAGRMVLGTWQGIYVFEHRLAPERRELVLHLIGE
jgi:secondary thiamine-phosphate synthase enzyme